MNNTEREQKLRDEAENEYPIYNVGMRYDAQKLKRELFIKSVKSDAAKAYHSQVDVRTTSLKLLDEFILETSKEDLAAIIKKHSELKTNGVTFNEYLSKFDEQFTALSQVDVEELRKEFDELCENTEDYMNETWNFFLPHLQKQNESDAVDIYSNELNTERISVYQKLAEEYNVSEGTIRDAFCKGAEWALSINSKTK